MTRFAHGDIVERTVKLSIVCIQEIKKEVYKKENYPWDYIYKQFGKAISSLGANITEANVSISNKECKRILSIALREGNEALYRIRIFHEGLDKKHFDGFVGELESVCKIINTIIQKID